MRVFISYRRADLSDQAQGFVGRIFDRLIPTFGAGNVFMDIDSIPLGEDFREYIGNQVAKANVVLVVIGPQWIEQIRARSNEQSDFVRIEIEAALRCGAQLIPILVGEASMPTTQDLPASLAPLAHRNALRIDSGRDFHAHVARLIEAIDPSGSSHIPARPARSAIFPLGRHTSWGTAGV